ncbi:MAG: HypC/HybG/HupF family hydrogenase formation chaperone [Ignavibacteria bacterium]|nr:HypC/HybG/HupF family hydrogenase formation chaperone [Ignavibacteria bacterium]
MCLAVPGKIEIIHDGDEQLRMAKVNFGGVKKDISLAWVPEAKVGDYVLVHVGFALNVIDENEAQETLKILQEMNELEDLNAQDDIEKFNNQKK